MNIAERLQHLDEYDLTAALRLRDGSPADYAKLAVHHYRAAKPATWRRILVLEDHKQRVAAVLIESLPSLSCRMRDYALDNRYRSVDSWRQRALLLNDEIRCISRVVVHPQWRGTGLAVRLVRHALATATTAYTEALAAMGKVNPFFERAGMTAYPRVPHPYDERLLAAMRRIGLSSSDLTQVAQVVEQVKQLQPNLRAWFDRELKRWYGHNGGKGCDRSADHAGILRKARDRLGLQPVYYLKNNHAESSIDHEHH